MSSSGTLPKVSIYFHVVINMTVADYLYSLDVTITQWAINKQGMYSSVGKYTLILLLCLFISVQLHMIKSTKLSKC